MYGHNQSTLSSLPILNYEFNSLTINNDPALLLLGHQQQQGQSSTTNVVKPVQFMSAAARKAAASKKQLEEDEKQKKEKELEKKKSLERLNALFSDDVDMDINGSTKLQEELINVNPLDYITSKSSTTSDDRKDRDRDNRDRRDDRDNRDRRDDRRDGGRDDRRDDRRDGGRGGYDRRDNRDNRDGRDNRRDGRDDRDNRRDNNNRYDRDRRDDHRGGDNRVDNNRRDNNNRYDRDRRDDRDNRGGYDRNNNNRDRRDPLPPPPPPPPQQSSSSSSSSTTSGEKRSREEEKEISDIKNEYYGEKKEAKKKPKKSERTRFVFEWDAAEDTSSDYNALYTNKVQAKPQFGRGVMGGFESTSRRLPSGEPEKDVPSTHWSKKDLRSMTDRDWRIFKEDFNISTKGGSIPNPIRTWRESSLPADMLEAIAKQGYEKPSPVQMQAIPVALSGRDVLGIAETGSGKTAAFVIPMLVYISKQPRMTKESEQDGPYAVVMAPTRELALQIEKEARVFANFLGYRTVALVGGQPIEEQIYQLSKGCEIVIATPGRLNDCLEKRYLVLNQCNYVVLDEADMMIDMGFELQVESVLDAMPSAFLKSENEEEAEKQERDRHRVYRTTILYSATMPPKVERLSRKYLRRPVHVIIGEAGKAVDRIKQTVIFVKSDNDKHQQMSSLLTSGPPPPIIVFVNKKKHCEIIMEIVQECGLSSTSLHSGRSQEQREMALEGFKKRKYGVLIATDVASRGIHVEGVTHVINYDMPNNIEDYTHRIGRTGRAGMEGLASSLITDKDTEIMYNLKNMLTNTNNIVPNELIKHPASQIKPGSVPDRQKRSETVIFSK
ncbi:putative RNA helicase [Cavenderia fasciculata]|uniref:RNA helicase n=1 Tax=Cavenderia fasciculata TaxID=261658 RepID=F4Q4M8_CACFS|nr:putative RNA helicase [Cavenderia fasciculata]EGG17037.1 putative RNA helicase [Cavenderia fasciculata]|eukprot:XP_004355521.1 putative RNA helicase [Cavenderia fasciculata]